MTTSVTAANVISPEPRNGEVRYLEVYDQDGVSFLNFTLASQECPAGSSIRFIKSANEKDMFFGLHCSFLNQVSSLGLYRFES